MFVVCCVFKNNRRDEGHTVLVTRREDPTGQRDVAGVAHVASTLMWSNVKIMVCVYIIFEFDLKWFKSRELGRWGYEKMWPFALWGRCSERFARIEGILKLILVKREVPGRRRKGFWFLLLLNHIDASERAKRLKGDRSLREGQGGWEEKKKRKGYPVQLYCFGPAPSTMPHQTSSITLWTDEIGGRAGGWCCLA